MLLDNLEFFFCQTRVSGCFSGTTTQKILAVPALQILFGPRPTFGQTGLTGRMFDRIFCSMRRSRFLWHRRFRARVNASRTMLPHTWETSSAKGMKSVQPVYFQTFEEMALGSLNCRSKKVCDGLTGDLYPGLNLARIAGLIGPVSPSDPEYPDGDHDDIECVAQEYSWRERC